MKDMITVLVIDDDPEFLHLLEILLNRNGMEVYFGGNGAHLFPSLDIIIPDIILMDVLLGDADGRELCSQLKKSDRFKEIPVILYSAAKLTPSSIEESLADKFFQRPFDNDALIHEIHLLTNQ